MRCFRGDPSGQFPMVVLSWGDGVCVPESSCVNSTDPAAPRPSPGVGLACGESRGGCGPRGSLGVRLLLSLKLGPQKGPHWLRLWTPVFLPDGLGVFVGCPPRQQYQREGRGPPGPSEFRKRTQVPQGDRPWGLGRGAEPRGSEVLASARGPHQGLAR